MSDHEFLRKAAKPKKGVLASEIASTSTDPMFYSAMKVLPNPDAVLRKLGQSQDVYDAILYDSHVMGEVRSMRGALLKHESRLQPGADDSDSMSAFELCQAVLKNRPARNMSWSDQIWSMFGAVYRGFSVSEIEWQRQGNHLVPCAIKDRPNRRFVFNHDHELRLIVKNNQFEGIELPDYKFLLTRHMPSYDNPYGVALLSSCFWPYTFKHNGFRWFTKFLERYGIPSPVGKYPMGTSATEQQELFDALTKMIEDAVAVIPEGNSVELLETKGSGHVPHKEIITLCNREMSKALTSQTLGSEVTEAGSRSTGEVQKARQDDNGEADREMVQRTMQTLCDWITQLNFQNATPPTWEWFDEQEVSKAQVETLKLTTEMVPVKEDELYARLQLTKPEKGDNVIFTGGNPTPTESSEFSQPGCDHSFKEHLQDELSDLADQGVEASKASVESMLSAIRLYAESADNLDDLDDALPDLLDDVEVGDFVDALADTNTIAKAKGIDDA